MVEGTGREERPRQPFYSVELREHDDAAEIAIVRIPREEDAGTVFADVWTNRFASMEAARTVHRVMMDLPGRWAGWVRMAQILGADFLAGLIEAEVIEASRIAAEEAEEAREDAERRERKAREAETVHVSLKVEGVPRIVARRGSSRFLMLILDTSAEARRVWDWVRWQTNSYQDWFVLVESQGAIALERLILDSMLVDESRVKAAGLSAGGRRPLRYWRPAEAVERDEEDGSDADDGDEEDEA